MPSKTFKDLTVGGKARFSNIAQGSIEECRYYLILAKGLGYGNTEITEENLEEISRLLEAYLRAVASSQKPAVSRDGGY